MDRAAVDRVINPAADSQTETKPACTAVEGSPDLTSRIASLAARRVSDLYTRCLCHKWGQPKRGLTHYGSARRRKNCLSASTGNDQSDGDGNPFGVEYALGTDWLAPDATNSANLAGFTTNGSFGAAFGFNPAATNSMAWILSRSTNLVSGIFEEIYRFEGPTGSTVTNAPVSVVMNANSFEITDLATPQPTNAYYRFEAELMK